jgi:serine/threonine-protein kinase
MSERIGPYRIGALLGEGGMARVYRATGPDGAAVALKLVRRDLAGDPDQRRRFAREVRAVQGITEPHLVPVLACGEHDGTPYLVQPVLDGGTLRDRLAIGPLPVDALVRLCRHVAHGLEALHARGIVHRDVKPANILFDADGRAHLADFGIVKQDGASVLTRPGQQVGTLGAMAPEQLRGEPVGPAADVYALGCVLWEAAAGAPLFGDRAGFDAMFAHLHDAPPAPAGVPPGVADVIVHALAKAPADRPPTARTLARLLRAGAA